MSSGLRGKKIVAFSFDCPDCKNKMTSINEKEIYNIIKTGEMWCPHCNLILRCGTREKDKIEYV
jgi:hypothetical protein